MKEKEKRRKNRARKMQKLRNFIKHNPKLVKKHLTRFALGWFAFLFVLLVGLFYWRPLTEHNTKTETVKIESVRIQEGFRGRRGRKRIYLHFQAEGKNYALHWINDDMDYTLAADLLTKEDAVTIITKPYTRIINWEFCTEVVDIHTDTASYHDLSYINGASQASSITLCVTIAILWLIYTAAYAIAVYLKFN